MTAIIRNLHVLAYTGGLTSWLYEAATATVATVDAPGFFDQMADIMDVGDAIICVCGDGTAMRYVTANKNGVITIAPMR